MNFFYGIKISESELKDGIQIAEDLCGVKSSGKKQLDVYVTGWGDGNFYLGFYVPNSYEDGASSFTQEDLVPPSWETFLTEFETFKRFLKPEFEPEEKKYVFTCIPCDYY